MTTTSRGFAGLSTTTKGRTDQLNRVYRGMADEMKRNQAEQSDYDDLSALSAHQLRRLVIKLQQDLADAHALLEDMRAHENGDQFAAVGKKVSYWDTARVARESGKSIATICRNAKELGGIKLGSDWVFPSGTRYGGKRKKGH